MAELLHAKVLCSMLGREGILNKEFLPETRRDGGAQPLLLISVPNKPGLNPKSLDSVFEVKANRYVKTSSLLAFFSIRVGY